MSDNRELLGTTSLKGLTSARLGGQGPAEVYPRIISEIRTRCGSDVASLFAEPVMSSRGDPEKAAVSWYTTLDDQAVKFSDIDAVAREPVGDALRNRLQRLRPILEDPQIGPIVASWLFVPSMEDVLAVGGNPVLINWNYLPDSIAASASEREKHFRQTLGRYAADLPPPPFTQQEAEPFLARIRRQAPSAARPVGGGISSAGASGGGESGATAQPVSPPPVVAVEPRRDSSRAALIATIIAAIILAILLIPGVLIGPGNQQTAADAERRVQIAQEDNRGLEERLKQLESAAQERVCRAPDGQLRPLAPLPGQPASPPRPAPRTDLLPPPPSQVRITPPPPAGGGPTGAPVSLADHLDRGVVFIVGKKSDGVSIGSGFFVTPDRIVTNRHVIEGIPDGGLLVTSRALGQALPAQVVAQTDSSRPGDMSKLDLAILSVNQPGRAVMTLGPSAPRGTAVMSAGYPGYLVEDDPGFKQLLGEGTRSKASPESVIQNGFVIQRRDADPVKLVTHSANLGRGNSGGPLVDLCGRVIGVNTWAKNEGEIATTANLAQDVTELRTYLAKHGISPQVDEAATSCPPAVASAPAAATPSPQPTPAKPGAK
jgi:S1-C subfamily serine protease